MRTQEQLLAKTTAPVAEISLILRAEHSDPFHVLGAHPVKVAGKPAIAVRAFLPDASQAWVVRDTSLVPLERIHAEGFFEAVFPGESQIFPYRLRATNAEGNEWELEDPYRFPPVLTDFDLHLLTEGTHYDAYEKLGAHLREIEGVPGVAFAVWAPNARRVSVVGDFNRWDGRRHPLRVRGASGIWELFLPRLGEGEIYKYEIKPRDNGLLGLKADPFAFYSELRPKTASVVHDIHRHTWHDQVWLAERRAGRLSTRPWRFTKSIWAPGCACRKKTTGCSTTASWRSGWWITSRRWVSPMSSSCR